MLKGFKLKGIQSMNGINISIKLMKKARVRLLL